MQTAETGSKLTAINGPNHIHDESMNAVAVGPLPTVTENASRSCTVSNNVDDNADDVTTDQCISDVPVIASATIYCERIAIQMRHNYVNYTAMQNGRD